MRYRKRAAWERKPARTVTDPPGKPLNLMRGEKPHAHGVRTRSSRERKRETTTSPRPLQPVQAKAGKIDPIRTKKPGKSTPEQFKKQQTEHRQPAALQPKTHRAGDEPGRREHLPSELISEVAQPKPRASQGAVQPTVVCRYPWTRLCSMPSPVLLMQPWNDLLPDLYTQQTTGVGVVRFPAVAGK